MKKTISTAFLSLLCLSIVSTLALNVAAQSNADSWQMYHHDLAHTGLTSSAQASGNQTLWTFTTGGPVWSSPAVVDGVVYVGFF